MLRGEVKGALTEDGVQMMEGAVEAGEVLRRMTNQLLDVSRLEEGKLPLERSMVDLTEVARDVCASLKTLANKRTLEVVGPSLVRSCDRELVRRVLENMVGNAIKHTPQAGRIQITVGRSTTGARVTVEDDGRGIPAEARDHIFEKFGPVASRGTRAHHSAGLGLAFCKLAIETQGGRVGVEAGAERGSVFWFELP
jgi:signal transduction histidine kinase